MPMVLKRISFLAVLIIFIQPGGLRAEEFLYKHQEGDRYRILSTVEEDVYVNDIFSHSAEILNRIAVEVISETGGRGRHRAVFQTSERSREPAVQTGRTFQWAREYESEFERDRLGRLTINRRYFMPVVRDVPVFPGRDLQPGDSWSNEAHEMHDFRDVFGIRDPYRIPFTANYTYLGERVWKGNSYPAFSVRYQIRSTPARVNGRIWPTRIIADSDQMVFWDLDLGQPVAYTETFNYRLELSDNRIRSIEYRGRAEAEIIESERMDKERIAEEIAEEILNLDIPNVTVRVADEGIVISLDDIQFFADSSDMLPGEREKLDVIADILRRYQDRDILVGGHTALAGTAEARQKLSAERAAVVADYLIEQNARTPERVVVRGYGAERPLASNSTEEGRRKNRRVEITILEN